MNALWVAEMKRLVKIRDAAWKEVHAALSQPGYSPIFRASHDYWEADKAVREHKDKAHMYAKGPSWEV